MSKLFIILIIISLCLRLLLTVIPGFKIDTTDWQAWTARLVEVGPINFYDPNYFADYFPGYLYILWILGNIFHFIFPGISFFSPEYSIFLKIVTNLFDFATTFLIFKILLKQGERLAYLGSLFYLLNPALIFNSSVWGQVDGVLTFFLVLSLYFLVELKKPIHWGILSTLSLLIKPQALVAFPIMFIYALKQFSAKSLSSIFLLLVLPIILSIPFFTKDPIFGLISQFQKAADGYPYTSVYAFNFWSLVGWWQSDAVGFLISYKTWGLVLFSLALLIIIYPFIKLKKNPNIYLATALSLLAFFLFSTRVHERYLFPFFAFLLIFAIFRRSVISITTYIILSIIHLVNLWYVYFYYNYLYDNPSLAKPALFLFIDETYNFFAILTLFAFIILIIIYYHDQKSKT